jgi:hypothetical protein
VLIVAVLVGVGIELVEASRFVTPLEWKDIGTDICGVILGGIAGWLLRRQHRNAT